MIAKTIENECTLNRELKPLLDKSLSQPAPLTRLSRRSVSAETVLFSRKNNLLNKNNSSNDFSLNLIDKLNIVKLHRPQGNFILTEFNKYEFIFFIFFHSRFKFFSTAAIRYCFSLFEIYTYYQNYLTHLNQLEKAWKPMLTPKFVINLFLICSIVFVPVGILLYFTSNNVNLFFCIYLLF